MSKNDIKKVTRKAIDVLNVTYYNRFKEYLKIIKIREC